VHITCTTVDYKLCGVGCAVYALLLVKDIQCIEVVSQQCNDLNTCDLADANVFYKFLLSENCTLKY